MKVNDMIAESEISALWPAAKLNIGTADDGRALYRTYVYILFLLLFEFKSALIKFIPLCLAGMRSF